MTTFDVNGIPVRVEDSGGDGPAVLFSHGFMMDHTMFDPQVEALAGDYRCIRWDERGFGDTPAPADFTYWDSADDAVGVLDACGVDQAVFVGMSQGGFLSLRAALAHPDRVRAIVLIDSAADIDDAETLEGYGGMLAALTGDDDEVWEAVAAGVAGLILGTEELNDDWIPKWRARRGDHRQDLLHAGATLVGRDDISERLSEITCPVLIIHGSEDQAITLDRARKVADAVADCRGVTVIDGAAHAPNLSDPTPVNAALGEFLSSL